MSDFNNNKRKRGLGDGPGGAATRPATTSTLHSPATTPATSSRTPHLDPRLLLDMLSARPTTITTLRPLRPVASTSPTGPRRNIMQSAALTARPNTTTLSSGYSWNQPRLPISAIYNRPSSQASKDFERHMLRVRQNLREPSEPIAELQHEEHNQQLPRMNLRNGSQIIRGQDPETGEFLFESRRIMDLPLTVTTVTRVNHNAPLSPPMHRLESQDMTTRTPQQQAPVDTSRATARQRPVPAARVPQREAGSWQCNLCSAWTNPSQLTCVLCCAWKCPSCETISHSKTNQCSNCRANKPGWTGAAASGTTSTLKATMTAPVISGFTLENFAGPSTFGFTAGTGAAAVTSTTTVTAATTTGFKVGASFTDSEPAPSTTGLSVAPPAAAPWTGSTCWNPSTTAISTGPDSGFSFGAPPATTAPAAETGLPLGTSAPTTSSMFGASAAALAPLPSFGFGAPAVTGTPAAPTSFPFGAASSTTPAAAGAFSFGSPAPGTLAPSFGATSTTTETPAAPAPPIALSFTPPTAVVVGFTTGVPTATATGSPAPASAAFSYGATAPSATETKPLFTGFGATAAQTEAETKKDNVKVPDATLKSAPASSASLPFGTPGSQAPPSPFLVAPAPAQATTATSTAALGSVYKRTDIDRAGGDNEDRRKKRRFGAASSANGPDFVSISAASGHGDGDAPNTGSAPVATAEPVFTFRKSDAFLNAVSSTPCGTATPADPATTAPAADTEERGSPATPSSFGTTSAVPAVYDSVATGAMPAPTIQASPPGAPRFGFGAVGAPGFGFDAAGAPAPGFGFGAFDAPAPGFGFDAFDAALGFASPATHSNLVASPADGGRRGRRRMKSKHSAPGA